MVVINGVISTNNVGKSYSYEGYGLNREQNSAEVENINSSRMDKIQFSQFNESKTKNIFSLYSAANNKKTNSKSFFRYDWRKLSSKVSSIKSPTWASQAIGEIRTELMSLRGMLASGNHSEKDLSNIKAAIAHAEKMEQIAVKKKNNLEKEEKARQLAKSREQREELEKMIKKNRKEEAKELDKANRKYVDTVKANNSKDFESSYSDAFEEAMTSVGEAVSADAVATADAGGAGVASGGEVAGVD